MISLFSSRVPGSSSSRGTEPCSQASVPARPFSVSRARAARPLVIMRFRPPDKLVVASLLALAFDLRLRLSSSSSFKSFALSYEALSLRADSLDSDEVGGDPRRRDGRWGSPADIVASSSSFSCFVL